GNGLEHLHVEREIRDERLQSTILVLEALQPSRIAYVEPAVLGLPAIEGVLADAVLAADRVDLLARFRLLEHAHDLFLREPALPHVALLRGGASAISGGRDRGGQVIAPPAIVTRRYGARGRCALDRLRHPLLLDCEILDSIRQIVTGEGGIFEVQVR